MDGLKQTLERTLWRARPRQLSPRYFFAGGAALACLPAALPGAQLRSIAARIATTSAPDDYICIASRATSTQMVQPKPWVSHSSTLPFGSRRATKHDSLALWPWLPQPQ